MSVQSCPSASVKGLHPRLLASGGISLHDLRGSFCPLLLAADVNLAEIADEAGNSVEVLSSNYLGVINEPRGKALVDAEGAIQVARASRVRHLAEGACDCYRPQTA